MRQFSIDLLSFHLAAVCFQRDGDPADPVHSVSDDNGLPHRRKVGPRSFRIKDTLVSSRTWLDRFNTLTKLQN